MIGKNLKVAVIRAAQKLEPAQAVLLDRYLEEFADEPIRSSVWVDLFEMANEKELLERLDPEGRIRGELKAGRLPGFVNWWGVSLSPAENTKGQLSLPLFH